jgi:hypothetical protein
MPKAPNKATGRPSAYSEELADHICNQLLEGRSMRHICENDEGMPHRSTVLRWMSENEAFATKCARARMLQADIMDDRILEVADACTPDTAQADRVKIAAYQWRASKLAPKKYGDRTELELGGKGPAGEITTTLLVTGVVRAGD